MSLFYDGQGERRREREERERERERERVKKRETKIFCTKLTDRQMEGGRRKQK